MITIFLVICSCLSSALGIYCFYLSNQLITASKVSKFQFSNFILALFMNFIYMGLVASKVINSSFTDEFILYSLQSILLIVLFRIRGEKDFLKIASAVTLSFFFTYHFLVILMGVLYGPLYKYFNQNLFSSISLSIIMIFAMIGYTAWIRLLFRKYKFHHLFQYLFAKKGRGILCFLFCLLLRFSYYYFWFIYHKWSNRPYLQTFTSIETLTFGILFVILVLFLILTASIFNEKQSKIQVQEAIILQQQSYLQSLEDIHYKMRTFRHDIQNMMAGMYLHSSSGDTAQIQSYLKSTIHYFDEQLGNEIQQVSALGNIIHTELKSLLLIKLMQAKKIGIDCQIEAITPIDEIHIEIEDFLRCLGILIDNAFEAVNSKGKNPIKITLVNDPKELHIVIANPTEVRPDIQRIADSGYTTKSKGRGLGLSIYRELLSKYPNVLTRTIYDNGIFQQELKIRRK